MNKRLRFPGAFFVAKLLFSEIFVVVFYNAQAGSGMWRL